jgi:hypothetical protein
MEDFSSYIYPLKNINQTFAFMQLYLESLEDNDQDFMCMTFNEIFKTSFTIKTIALIIDKFSNMLKNELCDLKSVYDKINGKLVYKPKLIKPPTNKCFYCSSILLQSHVKNGFAYYFDKPKKIRFQILKCYDCKIEYHQDTYIKVINQEKYLYSSNYNVEYVTTSSQTCFHIPLLKYLDECIIRSGMKFDGFTDIYNAITLGELEGRKLDRRRLSEGYFTYKIREYIKKQNQTNEIKSFDSKLSENYLEENIANFQKNFVLRWSKLHALNCKSLNCDNTSNQIEKTNFLLSEDLFITPKLLKFITSGVKMFLLSKVLLAYICLKYWILLDMKLEVSNWKIGVCSCW